MAQAVGNAALRVAAFQQSFYLGCLCRQAALKLSGKGAVNAAALVTALIKENYKVVGKVGIERLNKENAEAVVIPIRAEDLQKFSSLAKKFGVLYAAVEKTEGSRDAVHIISNTNYAAQLNAVLEEMSYPAFGKAKVGQGSKKEMSRVQPETPSRERGTGLTASNREDKPSVREHLAELKTVADGIKKQPQRSRGKAR